MRHYYLFHAKKACVSTRFLLCSFKPFAFERFVATNVLETSGNDTMLRLARVEW